MANLNIKFNNKTYSIDPASLADATASMEAHLMGMMEERLEGDGAEFHKFAPAALTFRSTAPLNELQEVQINGVTIDPSNYATEEGSTVITLPIEYLKTLDIDNYEITVVSDSKSVKGGFIVTASELNEHGFYYNQPYTAYVAILGGKKAFFLHEDGTLDVIDVASSVIETGTFTCNGKNASMTISIGTLTGTWADDGKSIYCNELQVTASLGDESIVADEDYIYIYKEDLGGYEVTAIDKTQAKYAAIKTDINGIDTVAIGRGAFERTNITTLPNIPDSVISISDYAFNDCSNLNIVIIPSGIKSIGRGAFSSDSTDYPSSLEEVVISADVISIGMYAFYNCQQLSRFTFEGTIAQWNAITKFDGWNLGVPATHVHCTDGDVAL